MSLIQRSAGILYSWDSFHEKKSSRAVDLVLVTLLVLVTHRVRYLQSLNLVCKEKLTRT